MNSISEKISIMLNDSFGASTLTRRVAATPKEISISQEIKDAIKNEASKGKYKNVCIIKNRHFNNKKYRQINLYPGKARLVEIDLASAAEADILLKEDKTPTLYILEDIDKIYDPRPILRKLKKVLNNNLANRLLIYIPSVLEDEIGNMPKDNSCHRAWTLKGLTSFLELVGFDTEIGINLDISDSSKYLFLVLHSDSKKHNKKLKSLNLPGLNERLIITNEHSSLEATGGIGSYIDELEKVLDEDKPLILYCGKSKSELVQKEVIPNNIIFLEDFIPEYLNKNKGDSQTLNFSVYEAIKTIICLYDSIKIIEYQEFLGLGAACAQSKISGEITNEILFTVRCHGSTLYISNAANKWPDTKLAKTIELERMSIRYADIISIPTNFLISQYKNMGYDMPRSKVAKIRLPYTYPSQQYKQKHKEIKKLIFIGHRSSRKRYEDFINSVLDITNPKSNLYCSQIKKIEAYGLASEESEILEKELVNNRKNIVFEFSQLSRKSLLSKLREEPTSSLIILPYPGDNHPVTVMEAMSFGIPFIAYNAGGIPEIVPEEFHKYFLCRPNLKDLTAKIFDLCKNNDDSLSAKISKLGKKIRYDQEYINNENIKVPLIKPRKVCRIPETEKLATIMVACYNTSLDYVLDTVKSLNCLKGKPKEVIFIDDASSAKEYYSKLCKLVNKNLNISHKVVRHKKNMGLAAARNTALKVCTTKYLISVDSDDIVSESFVSDYILFMENNNDYSVAVCGLESFNSNTKNPLVSPASNSERWQYHGIGDCYALGTAENIFGHSGSCVRVEDAKKIDGWDEKDKSYAEDWAFYLKLTSSGKKIFCIPKINYFYRQHENSMTKSMSSNSHERYLSTLRIARQIKILNSWESLRFFNYMQDAFKLNSEDSSARNLIDEISSNKHPEMNNIALMYFRFLNTHTGIKKRLLQLYRVTKKLKSNKYF